MSGAAGAGDPSMEDILASIRRILDEDQTPAAPVAETAASPSAGAAPPFVPAAEQVHEPGDELVLDMSMLMDGHAAAAPPPPAPHPPAPLPAPAPSPPMRAIDMPNPPDEYDPLPPMPAYDPPVPPTPGGGLIGPAAADETASSLMNLMRAVSSDRGAAVYRGGPTIEDVVREELRPLLKTWLDQHLPPLVERLVRSEIERVISRAAP